MLEQLVDLLHREAEAADMVAARTRALELIAAAGERRFLGMALDELEAATERLSGLELARSLTMMTAGFPADITATELVARFDGDPASPVARAIDELRQSSTRLSDARDRASAAIGHAAAATRARLSAAEAFASV